MAEVRVVPPRVDWAGFLAAALAAAAMLTLWRVLCVLM